MKISQRGFDGVRYLVAAYDQILKRGLEGDISNRLSGGGGGGAREKKRKVKCGLFGGEGDGFHNGVRGESDPSVDGGSEGEGPSVQGARVRREAALRQN